MKLYVINFTEPKKFADVKKAAAIGDEKALVYVNEGSNGKSFELQSEKAAKAVADTMGGVLSTIDVRPTDIMK
jgi:hypothetical protein